MNRLIRDSGFYHAPVTKVLLVWTGASSFLYRVLALSGAHPAVLRVLGAWALPSPGSWLAAAILLCSSRVLERRAGSARYMSFLLSAGVVAGGMAALIHHGNQFLSVPVKLTNGFVTHALLGLLAAQLLVHVTPLHCRRLGPLSLSTNLQSYLLVAMLSFLSRDSAVASLCGMVAGVAVQYVGVALPLGPGWLRRGLWGLLHVEQAPPTLSGATVVTQREQRMDQLEQMMMTFHQQRQGQLMNVQQRPPSEQQIQQMAAMGFEREAAQRALLQTGNDFLAAVQLLTARQNR